MQIPPITRTGFLGALTGGLRSLLPNPDDDNNNNVAALPPATRAYREPPTGVSDYDDNPSVFGRILNGDLPCRTYAESSELLAFRDRSARARLHALVIPKRFVQNVYSLTPDDASLVMSMREMGLEILEEQEPEAFEAEDYILCFHVPPFNSVDHLHMHVLAPASEMAWIYRHGKYNCGARWCACASDVVERLEGGRAAVPYRQISF